MTHQFAECVSALSRVELDIVLQSSAGEKQIVVAESHEPNRVWESDLLKSKHHASAVKFFGFALGAFQIISFGFADMLRVWRVDVT